MAVSTSTHPRMRPSSHGYLPLRLFRVPSHIADLSLRGIVASNHGRAEELKSIAQTFLDGYNTMLLQSPIERLSEVMVETQKKRHGFVVEGAAMGAALRDTVSLRGGMLESLLAVHGARFEYLIAVGAGWAIARMPWRARRILTTFDPILAPLVCDGRGFHDLFFNPVKAETGGIRRYRGALASGYDAGLGRALWFIASGDVQRLKILISRFEEKRRPDLLAGVGLAMAYAGPTTVDDWNALRAGHREDWKHVGQGVCFAAEAMRQAGVIPDHTELACQEALGLSSESASAIAASTRPSCVTRPFADDAYRSWRAQICARLASEVI